LDVGYSSGHADTSTTYCTTQWCGFFLAPDYSFFDAFFDSSIVADIALPELYVCSRIGMFLKIKDRDIGAFLG